jgi:hypothetical protein
MAGESDLLGVVQRLCLRRFDLHTLEGGQCDTRQQGYDADDDEQFDEGETFNGSGDFHGKEVECFAPRVDRNWWKLGCETVQIKLFHAIFTSI